MESPAESRSTAFGGFHPHIVQPCGCKNPNDSHGNDGILRAAMIPKFSPLVLAALSALAFMPSLGGCMSKEERLARRKWETQDERTTREVFQSNWLFPSVSEDEKEFFYRSWWKKD